MRDRGGVEGGGARPRENSRPGQEVRKVRNARGDLGSSLELPFYLGISASLLGSEAWTGWGGGLGSKYWRGKAPGPGPQPHASGGSAAGRAGDIPRAAPFSTGMGAGVGARGEL